MNGYGKLSRTMESEPAMYRYAHRIYTAMSESSDTELVDGVPAMVWRGSVTELYSTLAISNTHYSRIFRGLKKTGSITQLQRGARNTESIIALNHEPTLEQWRAYERSPLTRAVDFGTMKEKIDRMEGDKRDAEQQLRLEVEGLRREVSDLADQVRAIQTEK